MRVLIVDDDALVAQSLSTILSVEDDVDVVGWAARVPRPSSATGSWPRTSFSWTFRCPAGTGSVRPRGS